MKVLLHGRPTLKRTFSSTIRCFSSTRYEATGLSYYHHQGTGPLVYRTIGQQLEVSARKFPNTGAIISDHENLTITFPEALDRADKLAAGLANLGIEKGDRVAIWMPNKINWYIAFLSIARLGAISVSMNPALQVPEAKYCINKVGIKAMITTETFKTQHYHEMLSEMIPEIQTGQTKIESVEHPSMERIIIDSNKRLSGALTFDELSLKASESDVAEIRKRQITIQPDDGYNLQFTSGTTGNPKAALLSHYSSLNNAYHIGKRLEFDKTHHKICLNVPFFHTFGTNIGLLVGMAYGVSIYLPSLGFNAADSVKTIQKYKCTYAYGTPTMYVDIVNHVKQNHESLDSLRYAVTAGASISPKLLLDMQNHLGVERVRSMYGMTETSPVTFMSVPLESRDRVLDFVGKVQDHVEVKVVDADGNLVPFGVAGELWTRGYTNMLGYYEDNEKTDEIITRDRWLKTGDQFILHEDGFGKIVGRLKEMIIRGGENIFPKEIENFLITHPDIQEIHVVGVPDERMGEEVAAFIKLNPGKTALSHAEIKEFSKGKLAHFKIPRYIRIVSDFPKTVSGKIQKFKLAESFEA